MKSLLPCATTGHDVDQPVHTLKGNIFFLAVACRYAQQCAKLHSCCLQSLHKILRRRLFQRLQLRTKKIALKGSLQHFAIIAGIEQIFFLGLHDANIKFNSAIDAPQIIDKAAGDVVDGGDNIFKGFLPGKVFS